MSKIERATQWDLPEPDAADGQLEAAWEAFDLHGLVAQIESVLSVAARAKGISLAVRSSPGLPARVIGDADQLQWVLAALLENAINSTDRGEVVASIGSDPTTQTRIVLCVEVSDTGSGAERLQAGDAARLAASRALVELMDGQLDRSSAHGAGSTCVFRLPLGLPKPRLSVA